MAKNPRLHEVAKAVGVSAKLLMAELSSKGFEFKTHMASVGPDPFKFLEKKYPQLGKQLKKLYEEAAAAPKKAKTTKTRKGSPSKVISRRSVSKKQSKSSAAPKETKSTTSKIEIVQDQQGETVEQKVIKGGIIRRRRVETPVQPEQKAKPATSPAFQTEASNERVSSRNEESSNASPSNALEQKAAAEAESQESTSKAHGRNLSATKRLKIVGKSMPPRPATAEKEKASVKTDKKPATIAVRSKESEGLSKEESEEKKKAKESERTKKKGSQSLKNWVAPRVTKKDLLSMTEEVEITRPMGRRQKKSSVRREKKTKITTPGEQKRKIRIEGEISVFELADRMGLKAVGLVRKLASQGQMLSAHQKIDYDTAALMATDYGYEVIDVAVTAEKILEQDEMEDDAASLKVRPPVVTIMGHVDHGKTSLLDYIRKSRVVNHEAGGITQHIGAYQVTHEKKLITFLDTPGHEAFTKIRARGASVTDIVVLVVAADEGVKPQTLEAIAHAKAAEVPIIVAINKMDKPEANPDRVMQELAGHGLAPEDWGGDTIYTKVSAHTGEGVPNLLEMILMQAEVLDLKANPNRPAKAVVIESRLDKGRGAVGSIVVTNGTLKLGDPLVSGTSFGKVRAMYDETGKSVSEAGPSKPIEVLGFGSVPSAGENVSVVSEESVARKASDLALTAKREENRRTSRISLEEMFSKMKSGDISELRIVLKGDVQGSIEAIADSLEKIKHDEVKVNVIHKAVGGISESDISLAAASEALVIGFNVRPMENAKQLSNQENVQIKTYNVIYELIDDVKRAMEGLLSPEVKESVLGQAEVREVFSLSKAGTIAGCFVKSGKIHRNKLGRVIRDSVIIYQDQIASVRRFKEDTREVAEGFECGIKLQNFSDLKPGDIIECYEQVELAKAVS